MNEIREKIIGKLDEIERTENVRILYCAESGSRAWGFASPDSDYDVRFIYLRDRNFYLRLDRTRDVIEWQIDDIYDINGWDIQKTLRLVHTSNPTVFEWSNSPIVYRRTAEWDKISEILGEYFSPVRTAHHYLSMAHTNGKKHLGRETVKLKKYFYVLRPLLCCKYVLEKNSPPPMLFSELIETELDPAVRPYVDDLLDKKMNLPETETGGKIIPLHEYIAEMFSYLDEKILSAKQTNPGWDRLNELFWQLTE